MEACRVIFDVLPELPHLPELPVRGVGAGTVGRTIAALVDLYAELGTFGWRLMPRQHEGVDVRRARSMLAQDLDALEEVGQGFAGPIKVQLCGPWTMAANVELPRGEKVLADAGACRELTESLAEGAARHVRDVRRRLPGVTDVLLEFEESFLPSVMAGEIPTSSGFGRLALPDEMVVEQSLRHVLEAPDAVTGIRFSGRLTSILRAGARFVAAPAQALEALGEDALGEAMEAGTGFLVGAPEKEELWRRLDREAIVITPAGGLAELSETAAVTVLRRCRDAARSIQEGDA